MNAVAAVLLSTLAVAPPAGVVFPDPAGAYSTLRVVVGYDTSAGWYVWCEPAAYPEIVICLRRPADVWAAALKVRPPLVKGRK